MITGLTVIVFGTLGLALGAFKMGVSKPVFQAIK